MEAREPTMSHPNMVYSSGLGLSFCSGMWIDGVEATDSVHNGEGV